MEYIITEQDLVRGTARDLILFVMYLFQTLPLYVPKTTLEFRGSLHERIVKCIELSNPAASPIEYAVRLDAGPEFSISDRKIRIGAKVCQYATPF